MENKSYSNGMKIVGVMLHFFFTLILTIALFLLGQLMNKEILELTDIGTKEFLQSGYYTRCIQKKCSHLSEYLYLLLEDESHNAEENWKYLQYTNEFKSEDTNVYFWFKNKEGWYTNQSDKDEQLFDTEAILKEARAMGNYLLYDRQNKRFETNINKLSEYFFEGANVQLYWPPDDFILMIGINTQLSAKDDLYYANAEYRQVQPWIKAAISAVLLSAIGWIITLVYLALVAGHRPEDEEIHLNFFDQIKTELLILGFAAIAGELIFVIVRVNSLEWELSGILVASGTVCLVTDALFLLFFLSMVKLMKAEMLWKNCFLYWFLCGFSKLVKNKTATVQTVVGFLLHLISCFVLAVAAFHYQIRVAFLLLLAVCAVEGYLLLRKAVERLRIIEGVEQIRNGALDIKIDLEELHGDNKYLAEAINNIGAGLEQAVQESTRNERMKADLITNVSHDIKTPLTSIVNYVDLLKRENIKNERAEGYIQILDEKAKRLKQLTEDLVEASKVSSGNVKLDMQVIDLVELLYQTAGEFNEKLESRGLTIVTKLPNTPVYIEADGRQLYRVMENLYNNVAKYAMEQTRVYVEIAVVEAEVSFSIKNVSEKSLALENSQAGDLTERFTRGDASRTTEGSGLGLSIAKNLTQLMGGSFAVSVDGDLFKATLKFKRS